MVKPLLILLSLLVTAVPAVAGDGSTDLRGLVTGDDTRGWEGVGRLNIGTRSFCTGALIAENLVLTAGHCLYEHKTRTLARPEEIEFLAGWRGGRAEAYRGARRLVVHPRYIADDGDRSVDLGLIELDRPIRNTQVLPFDTGRRAFLSREVGVVSYAFDRAERPSLQSICHVLGRTQGTLVLDCAVDFGSSGAPVFDLSGDAPRIISVVSAKGTVGDMPVSLGTSLEGPLADMKAILEAADGGMFETPQTSPGIVEAERSVSSTNGAKFVRP